MHDLADIIDKAAPLGHWRMMRVLEHYRVRKYMRARQQELMWQVGVYLVMSGFLYDTLIGDVLQIIAMSLIQLGILECRRYVKSGMTYRCRKSLEMSGL